MYPIRATITVLITYGISEEMGNDIRSKNEIKTYWDKKR